MSLLRKGMPDVGPTVSVVSAFIVTDEGIAFFEKAGWIARGNGWWTKPAELAQQSKR